MPRFAVVALAIAALVGACTSTQSLLPGLVSVDRPMRGETVVAELGDIVLERAQSRRYDAILLENEVTWFDLYGFRQFVMRPGRLVAREADEDFTYYFSDQLTSREALSGAVASAPGGICIRKSAANYVRAFSARGVCGVTPDQRPSFTPLSVPEAHAHNYRRELIYGGRSGSVLSFLYRELSGDQPYPTLSLDFHVDLADGPVFGLRGARIEVVDATNAKLTYRVVSSFAELQR